MEVVVCLRPTTISLEAKPYGNGRSAKKESSCSFPECRTCLTNGWSGLTTGQMTTSFLLRPVQYSHLLCFLLYCKRRSCCRPSHADAGKVVPRKNEICPADKRPLSVNWHLCKKKKIAVLGDNTLKRQGAFLGF